MLMLTIDMVLSVLVIQLEHGIDAMKLTTLVI